MILKTMQYLVKPKMNLKEKQLKSKMFLLISVNDGEVSKAKGVNKKIKYKEFIDFLFNKKVIKLNMKRIQGKLHELGTYDVYKISLSCFDIKKACIK